MNGQEWVCYSLLATAIQTFLQLYLLTTSPNVPFFPSTQAIAPANIQTHIFNHFTDLKIPSPSNRFGSLPLTHQASPTQWRN
jgi:hypothetical protein